MFRPVSLSLTLSLSLSLPLSQGERGVEEVLNILKDEFHTSMALTGECVYSSFPYLELKVGVAPSPPTLCAFPQARGCQMIEQERNNPSKI